MRSTESAAAALSVLALAILAPSAPAFAGTDEGNKGTERSGGTVSTWVMKDVELRPGPGVNVDPGNGSFSKSGSYTPPPCWYGNSLGSPAEVTAWAKELLASNYANDTLPLARFALEIAEQHTGDKGIVLYPSCRDVPEAATWRASHPLAIWWPEQGPAPQVEGAPSPEMLAHYARASMVLPVPQVERDPAGNGTVNLPTWVWLDKARFSDMEITASVPGLSVTVTAHPKHLRIATNSGDAELFPASTNGQCHGTGVAYVKGVSNPKADPPCGVVFRRSSARAGAFQITPSLVWTFTTTVNGLTLDDGTLDGVPEDVQVQEIQTVVTDTR